RPALQRLANACAPGRVVWRDSMPQPELRDVYAAADVLALPSLREGWPNVVLESIACGTPVVAADVGGVPEILGRLGAPGQRVKTRSVRDWAAALDSVISDHHSPMSVRAYARAFGWEEIVERQCTLYESVHA